MCDINFKDNPEVFKVIEHNHFNGKYRGASCQSCNTKEGKDSKIIPVVFHNGSKFDFHLLIEELAKRENKYNKVTPLAKNSEEYIIINYGTNTQKLRFLDSYRFLPETIDNISKGIKDEDFKHMSSTFNKKFETLKFKTFNEEENKEERTFKGIFPYEYIDNIDKLKETKLPSFKKNIPKPKSKTSILAFEKGIRTYLSKHYWETHHKTNFKIETVGDHEKAYKEIDDNIEEEVKNIVEWFKNIPTLVSPWYSHLNDKDITKEEEEQAKKIWKEFNCKTLKDYHDIYLKCDVLILADAFENFRDFFLKHHKIDPCYCFSAPSLTWQCGMKFKSKDVKLELLSDNDMLLMLEKGKRGGYSGLLGPRNVKAFNKYTTRKMNTRSLSPIEYKQLQTLLGGEEINLSNAFRTNFILHFDMNNLYGGAMSMKLPTNDFKWEEDSNYYLNIPEGKGCFVEVDLKYSKKCKNLTNKYPLAPQNRVIDLSELSDKQKELLKEDKLGKVPKLILDLHDKKNYVIHNEVLEYYISMGMEVTKVYRTISFNEEAWLKPYIDFNTKMRMQKGISTFEKNLWKLMNNAFYGKTLENIRDRVNIELLTKKGPDDKEAETKAKKIQSKPTFKDKIIFNDNFNGFLKTVPSVYFDKPIYTGIAILDYSKLIMYKFYYNLINKAFPDNLIIFSDTDSLVINAYTDDAFKDLEKIKDELDASDFPKDHPLYSEKNKKVIGKFKERNGKVIEEIICIRSKVYSEKINKISDQFHKYEQNLDEYYDLMESELDEKVVKKLKGITHSVIRNYLTFNDYFNCLLDEKDQYNTMYTMNSKNHINNVNKLNKKSSAFYDKGYVLEDGINTLPHCKEEDRERIYNSQKHLHLFSLY